MPSRKAADGEYRDIAHPINSDTRNMIQTLILEQYEAMNLGILTQQRQKSKIKRITSSSKCRKRIGY